MSRAIQVSTIMQQIRRRSDQDKSKFISDDELINLIDLAVNDLYTRLAQLDYYSVMWADFTPDGGTDIFSLPANFYKILGLEDSDGHKLKPINFNERDKYNSDSIPIICYYPETSYKYCLLANTIMIRPTPPAKTLRLYYIPVPERITTSTQTIDPIIFEEFIVLYCILRIGAKAEEDTKNYFYMFQEELKRIEEFAYSRNKGQSEHMNDDKFYREYY